MIALKIRIWRENKSGLVFVCQVRFFRVIFYFIFPMVEENAINRKIEILEGSLSERASQLFREANPLSKWSVCDSPLFNTNDHLNTCKQHFTCFLLLVKLMILMRQMSVYISALAPLYFWRVNMILSHILFLPQPISTIFLKLISWETTASPKHWIHQTCLLCCFSVLLDEITKFPIIKYRSSIITVPEFALLQKYRCRKWLNKP